ncbi:MAG: Gfo/Idh/MocA family oxidoreductase [Verrucomicrobia bacterium]|nr:Gfo/Idh/MocA family oxidoreductase [Verrucomicrobiota bacterium]
MNKSSRKKVRVAAVGIGGRGEWAAEKLAGDPRFDLIALCDRNGPRLADIQQKLGLQDVKGYETIASCLKDAAPDAVVVTTPDGHHAEVAVPCLEAGKFVFVEKPLEITEPKCRALINADLAAGEKTFVGFNLRYAPVYEKIKELIDAGAIGKILTIQADEFYDGGRTYFRRWHRLQQKGGGLWITKACHDFDILYWLAGKKPLSVHAIAQLGYYRPRSDAPLYCKECSLIRTCPDCFFTFGLPNDQERAEAASRVEKAIDRGDPRPDLCLYNSDKDTFDHGIATVEFEDSILATYTCNVVAGFSNRRIRVSGTKGTIDGELLGRITLHKRDPPGIEEVPVSNADGGHGGADDRLFAHFHDFVRGHPVRMVRPQEAIVPVLMGLAATRSVAEKRSVRMSEFASLAPAIARGAEVKE